MKVGDYVRTKRGEIHKISDLKGHYENGKLIVEKQLVYINNKCSGWNYEQFNEIIIKSSPNIIDLIEVGDYVNGMKITNKFIDEETDNIELEFNNGSSYLYPKSWNYEARSKEYKIKSIVTKEQFSQMEYRIG